MSWLLAALLGPLCAQPSQPPEDCHAGYERVPTNNPIEPFHCKPMHLAQPNFIPMIPKHKLKISCPPGTEAKRTPGELERWRCVPAKRADSAEPDLAPVLMPGTKTSEGSGEKKADASGFSAPTDYERYTIKDQLQFEYPRDWHVVEGWNDEVPTLYFEFDTGRQGKQITLVISRITKNQASFEDMDSAIAHEIEYQNSADAGKGTVGTFPARFTKLASTSRTAYIKIGIEDYFTISYSAPEDLFKTFLPVYQRLLKSFKIGKGLVDIK
jgi:hypothetical protein